MRNGFSLNLADADKLGIGLFKYSLGKKERFLVTNSFLPKMLGYSPKDNFKKIKLAQLFVSANERSDFFKTVLFKGKVRFFEAIFRDKKNKPLWVVITASLIKKQKTH